MDISFKYNTRKGKNNVKSFLFVRNYVRHLIFIAYLGRREVII